MDVEAVLADAEAELATISARSLALNKVITGLKALRGIDVNMKLSDIPHTQSRLLGVTEPAISAVIYPKPREAVLQALKEQGGQPVAPKAIIALIKQMGMYDPNLKSGDNGYTTALRRLMESEKYPVHRASDGSYFYADSQPQVAAGTSLGVLAP